MVRQKLKLVSKGLGFAIILQMLSVNLQALEQDIIWITDHSSAQVSRVTMSLSAGHMKRGIRLARSIDPQGISDRQRLVLQHNLCLALLQTGELRAAAQHCTVANHLARGYWLERQRGAWLIRTEQERDGIEAVSLSTVMIRNILNSSDQMSIVWRSHEPVKGHPQDGRSR